MLLTERDDVGCAQHVRTRLAILGPLVVGRDDDERIPRASRQRRLLTILAVAAGRDGCVTVEEMVDALYGADASPKSRHSLATELWRARQVLGPDAIITDRDGYRLDLEHCDVDVAQFEADLADGRALLRAGDFAEAEAKLAAALTLWRGEPVAEWRDHPLGEAAVSRLAELRTGGTVDHAEALIGTGRHAEAAALLETVTAAEPTREHAWALLVEACLATGRLRHAREAFDTARRTLAEYGVEIGAELSVVGDRLMAGPATSVPSEATAIVGRDAELARIVSAATRALHGTDPALVLIGGEAGIGKTALAEQAVADVQVHGLRVGRMRCDPRLDLPYAALLPLVARLAADVPSVSSEIATLLRTDGRQAQDPVDGSRAALVAAIGTLLESSAQSAPQLLLVDDAQWATPAVLEVVLHLLARRAAVPLCVLLTVREPAVVAPEVDGLLAELWRRASEAVLLPGLDAVATGRLLGADPAAPQVREALRLSGGNPLYLRQLARGWRAGIRGGGTLSAAIQDHLGCLSPQAREVLRLAAVIGTQFDVRTVTAAAARAEPPIPLTAVADALDAAASAGLLRVEVGGGHRTSFVHALVRDELYAAIPPGARRVAHALVGRASERLVTGDATSLDLIAHHYSAGWPVCPTASVVERLRAAGDQAAAQLGFAKAREYYKRALDLTAMDPDFADPAVEAALLEASAHLALAVAGEQVAGEQGRVPDSEHIREPRAAFAALRHLAVGQGLADVRLRAALGTLSTYSVQRIEDAVLDELDAALHGVLDSGPSPLTRAAVGEAIAALYLHRPERGRLLLERAEEVDPDATDQLLRAVWERQDVRGKLATARRLTGGNGDPAAAWLRLWVSEVAAGQRALDDPPAVLERLPEPDEPVRWELTGWRVATAIAAGRFDRARRLITTARRTGHQGTPAALTASRLATLMAQELRLLMLTSAEPVSPERTAVPKQTWTQSHPIMISWRGYAAAAIGQTAAARTACDTLVDDLLDGRVPAGELLPVTAALALSAIEVGHRPGIDAAREALAGHSGEHATNYFTVYWGAVDHHAARLAAVAGDLDDAVERFEQAVVQHRHAGARPYEARSLHGLAAARWHRARGSDRQEAQTSYRMAVALARELPMPSIVNAPWPPPAPVT